MLTAIGLMSGTSLDGVDAAVVTTDGTDRIVPGTSLTRSYGRSFNGITARALATPGRIRVMTDHHIAAVADLMRQSQLTPRDVDVIGFPGQTVAHAPEEGWTWQVGDAGRLARATGVRVVTDFRSRDIANGGQGAPLAPLFHRALTKAGERPLAILNFGGVGNVTWLGADGTVLAFDTGPGCAPIDDHARRVLGTASDRDGRLAAEGRVSDRALEALLADPFFSCPPPKSIDRDHFRARCDAISRSYPPADAAALLTAFSAAAAAKAQTWMPARPRRWLVTGGGRHNPTLMAELDARIQGAAVGIETIGFDGDCLEAQAFAWLAVRSLLSLPLAVPDTTGVVRATSGGVLVYPRPAWPGGETETA